MNNKVNYKVGDTVKVRKFLRTKFHPYFTGSYEIIEINFNTVKVKNLNTLYILQ